MPRVSVIIPSYNHEKYVAESLNSVFSQTYQDFEIIITDDGSQDRTVEVIKQFNDPRIKLFCFSQNQGAVVAANHCIQNAQGEFIALLNSDDVFKPQKLEVQVKFLDENSNIGAVFSQAQFIGENSQVLTIVNYENFDKENRTRFEWLNYFFYHGNCLCHPSILIRKECYDNIGLYDPRLAQLPDFEFWIRLCQKYEIFVLPEKLVKFRIRDNEANASAYTTESRRRIYIEYPMVFQQYLNSSILDNLEKVFPEAIPKEWSKHYSNDFDILGYYLIANLCLESKISSINYLGINIMYDLLSDSNFMDHELIKQKLNYTDLIKISGNYEIFSDQNLNEEFKFFKSSKVYKIWIFLVKFKRVFLKIISRFKKQLLGE